MFRIRLRPNCAPAQQWRSCVRVAAAVAGAIRPFSTARVSLHPSTRLATANASAADADAATRKRGSIFVKKPKAIAIAADAGDAELEAELDESDALNPNRWPDFNAPPARTRRIIPSDNRVPDNASRTQLRDTAVSAQSFREWAALTTAYQSRAPPPAPAAARAKAPPLTGAADNKQSTANVSTTHVAVSSPNDEFDARAITRLYSALARELRDGATADTIAARFIELKRDVTASARTTVSQFPYANAAAVSVEPNAIGPVSRAFSFQLLTEIWAALSRAAASPASLRASDSTPRDPRLVADQIFWFGVWRASALRSNPPAAQSASFRASLQAGYEELMVAVASRALLNHDRSASTRATVRGRLLVLLSEMRSDGVAPRVLTVNRVVDAIRRVRGTDSTAMWWAQLLCGGAAVSAPAANIEFVAPNALTLSLLTRRMDRFTHGVNPVVLDADATRTLRFWFDQILKATNAAPAGPMRVTAARELAALRAVSIAIMNAEVNTMRRLRLAYHNARTDLVPSSRQDYTDFTVWLQNTWKISASEWERPLTVPGSAHSFAIDEKSLPYRIVQLQRAAYGGDISGAMETYQQIRDDSNFVPAVVRRLTLTPVMEAIAFRTQTAANVEAEVLATTQRVWNEHAPNPQTRVTAKDTRTDRHFNAYLRALLSCGDSDRVFDACRAVFDEMRAANAVRTTGHAALWLKALIATPRLKQSEAARSMLQQLTGETAAYNRDMLVDSEFFITDRRPLTDHERCRRAMAGLTAAAQHKSAELSAGDSAVRLAGATSLVPVFDMTELPIDAQLENWKMHLAVVSLDARWLFVASEENVYAFALGFDGHPLGTHVPLQLGGRPPAGSTDARPDDAAADWAINSLRAGFIGSEPALAATDMNGYCYVWLTNQLNAASQSGTGTITRTIPPPIRLRCAPADSVAPRAAGSARPDNSAWSISFSPPYHPTPFLAVGTNAHHVFLFDFTLTAPQSATAAASAGAESKTASAELPRVSVASAYRLITPIHGHNVPCLDVDPSGQYIASTNIDKHVRVMNAHAARIIRSTADPIATPDAASSTASASTAAAAAPRAPISQQWGWAVRWLQPHAIHTLPLTLNEYEIEAEREKRAAAAAAAAAAKTAAVAPSPSPSSSAAAAGRASPAAAASAGAADRGLRARAADAFRQLLQRLYGGAFDATVDSSPEMEELLLDMQAELTALHGDLSIGDDHSAPQRVSAAAAAATATNASAAAARPQARAAAAAAAATVTATASAESADPDMTRFDGFGDGDGDADEAEVSDSDDGSNASTITADGEPVAAAAAAAVASASADSEPDVSEDEAENPTANPPLRNAPAIDIKQPAIVASVLSSPGDSTSDAPLLLAYCTKTSLFLLDGRTFDVLDHRPRAVSGTILQPAARYESYDRLLFCEYIPALSILLIASAASTQVTAVQIVRYKCGAVRFAPGASDVFPAAARTDALLKGVTVTAIEPAIASATAASCVPSTASASGVLLCPNRVTSPYSVSSFPVPPTASVSVGDARRTTARCWRVYLLWSDQRVSSYELRRDQRSAGACDNIFIDSESQFLFPLLM